MRSTILKVEGMRCTGCAQTIKAIMGTEPGVQAAEVSYESGEARVLYDPQTTEEDRLVNAIEKMGFKVAPRTS